MPEFLKFVPMIAMGLLLLWMLSKIVVYSLHWYVRFRFEGVSDDIYEFLHLTRMRGPQVEEILGSALSLGAEITSLGMYGFSDEFTIVRTRALIEANWYMNGHVTTLRDQYRCLADIRITA